MAVSFEIAKKEFKLLLKSTRRIFLLFMMPLIILLIGIVGGFIAIYVIPSSTGQAVDVMVIQDDPGINSSLNWGSTYYSMLKSSNGTKNFNYSNETYTHLHSLLNENNFSILIYVPANFSSVINQTNVAHVYVYYDNSKLSNEDAVNSIMTVTATLNIQLVYLQYGGPINLNRVVLTATGTSKGSGALLASSLSIIPLYLVIFLVIPPITLVLISVTIEREQKTLESVLLQPIDRKDFIAGKILYGVLIVLMNTILTVGSILVLIVLLIFMLPSDQINQAGPVLNDIINNLLGSESEFWLLILYVFVGLVIISLLLVAVAVFFSMMARDEREANMVISSIIIFPLISIIFLVYLPLGSLPDMFLIILGALPVIGYLFSIYLILLKGGIILTAWLSLIFQILWIFLIIWFAGRLIESEGILHISFKKVLRFWEKN